MYTHNVRSSNVECMHCTCEYKDIYIHIYLPIYIHRIYLDSLKWECSGMRNAAITRFMV